MCSELAAAGQLVHLQQAGSEPRVYQLKHMNRMGQVAQPMQAEIAQAHVWWQRIPHHALGGGTEESLAAACHGEQAGTAVDGGAVVVARAQVRRPGVQRHSHAQRRAGRPGLGVEAALNLEGRADGVRRVVESHAEGIAHRLEHAAAMAFDSGGKQTVVTLQGHTHGLRLLLPQGGRALDVGEQKGERHQCPVTHRQTCHRHCLDPHLWSEHHPPPPTACRDRVRAAGHAQRSLVGLFKPDPLVFRNNLGPQKQHGCSKLHAQQHYYCRGQRAVDDACS